MRTGAGGADAPCRAMSRRPEVSSADDASNFEDYSELGPMRHEFKLSSAEQALFVGF